MSEGQHDIPMEGEDITPKKDGGVLKVSRLFSCILRVLGRLG